MKIFISYSRRDSADFARKISETLEDEHSIFTDINDIQLGDAWSNTIEDNIASCDIFLIIVTFAALKSSEVEKEVLQAQNKKKKIIPCFYVRVKRNELKWGLGGLQGIEFANEDQLAREIYWKIYQYQNKVQPILDETAQATVEPVKKSKQESVKETEVVKVETETIKPKVVKAEEIKTEDVKQVKQPVTSQVASQPTIKKTDDESLIQPTGHPQIKEKNPIVGSAKIFPSVEESSLKIREKRPLGGSKKKKIVLIAAVAIGVVIALFISSYYSMNTPAPEQVEEVNNPPVATDMALTTTVMNEPFHITLSGGDQDTQDFLKYVVVAQPSNGQLYQFATNLPGIVYTPNSGFRGCDDFTYKISDGSTESNIARVTIKVGHLKDICPPEFNRKF